MPKKVKKESQKEQSARFEKTVRDMIKDGDLNPKEADEAFDRAMSSIKSSRANDR